MTSRLPSRPSSSDSTHLTSRSRTTLPFPSPSLSPSSLFHSFPSFSLLPFPLSNILAANITPRNQVWWIKCRALTNKNWLDDSEIEEASPHDPIPQIPHLGHQTPHHPQIPTFHQQWMLFNPFLNLRVVNPPFI
jgi:hypothetical protein